MTGTRRYRLSARARKAMLLLHIAAAGAWLGMDLVLGILVVTALTADPVRAGSAAASLATFTTWPLATTGLVTLASGVVLGLGTKYGLARYWWVLVKLVLNVVLVALVLLVLGPGTAELAKLARDALADGTTSATTPTMLFPPVVSSTAVLAAIALSIFKPWGRISGSRSVATMTDQTREREEVGL